MEGELRVVLDLCGREAVVAVARGAEVLREQRFPGRGAAELVTGQLQETLAEAGCAIAEVRAVVVVRGPGSFTGVRVGLATAKGLAEGLGVGLVGLSRLAVLADGDEVLAVLEAGRGEWFWGRYVLGRCEGEGVGTVEEIRSMGGVVVAEAGSGWEGAQERPIGAEAMVRVAAGLPVEDPIGVEGLYLRRTAEELLERQAAYRRRREEL